ncbi:MAG: O-antigen ligase family protein [Hyphomicrobium sp.]|nr:O-antigen ligase family protein [Hyphomicrobium sp.]
MTTAAIPFDLVPTQIPTVRGRVSPSARPMSAVHWLALAAVWLTFAASGVVFSEPAPVDVLGIGLCVLLPLIGLVAVSPMLLGYLAVWLVAASGAFLAASFSRDIGDSTIHTTVSLYLYVHSFVIAAFVAKRPERHVTIIMTAWLAAALVAATAGVIGYFGLLPGSEIFTKFGRAAGTFKDPNVFGPFLVPPLLFCLHTAINGSAARAILALGVSGFLAVAVLLSFSRGAWMVLALSTVVYAWLSYVTASTNRQRLRIIGLGLAAVGVGALAVFAALQIDGVSDLLAQRASMTQSYDVGPDGRFGGQQKAIGLILDHPLGIGAQQFAPVYHHEEVHNVFLSIVLNAGWLGGGMYWIAVALTIVLGARHVLRASAMRPMFIIAYATFLATALEGFIIDSDHWRHFYVLMALVWGLMAARRTDAAHDT